MKQIQFSLFSQIPFFVGVYVIIYISMYILPNICLCSALSLPLQLFQTSRPFCDTPYGNTDLDTIIITPSMMQNHTALRQIITDIFPRMRRALQSDLLDPDTGDFLVSRGTYNTVTRPKVLFVFVFLNHITHIVLITIFPSLY